MTGYTEVAVPVLNPQGTGETGDDRPAASHDGDDERTLTQPVAGRCAVAGDNHEDLEAAIDAAALAHALSKSPTERRQAWQRLTELRQQQTDRRRERVA